jgi:hypothetical protein
MTGALPPLPTANRETSKSGESSAFDRSSGKSIVWRLVRQLLHKNRYFFQIFHYSLPVVYLNFVQVASGRCQVLQFSPFSGGQIANYHFNFMPDIGALIVIKLPPIGRVSAESFGLRLSHESEKFTPAISDASVPIPVASQPVIGSRSYQTANDAREDHSYDLKDDLIEVAHYLIVAIIAGFTAAFYTRRLGQN